MADGKLQMAEVAGIADPLKIPGWYDWNDWNSKRVRSLADGDVYVEVGCFLGRSTCALGRIIHQNGVMARVHAVDPFRMWADADPQFHALLATMGRTDVKPGDSFRDLFEANLRANGVAHLVDVWATDSVTAARGHGLESARVVFIDGDHSYKGVVADIMAWWPVLKKGGIMGGHDIHTYQDVSDAVRDCMTKLGQRVVIEPEQNVWWTVK